MMSSKIYAIYPYCYSMASIEEINILLYFFLSSCHFMPVLFAFITHIGTALNFLGEGSVYIFSLKQTSFTRTKN